jgi:phosphatidylglycerol:prolipoprotein diacylglycerol transferase
MLLIAYGLWRARDLVRPAVLFAWYLLLSGTERFLVEFIRRNPAEVLGLTEAQVLSLVLMLAGAVWLGQLRRAGPWRRADAGGAAIAPVA